MALRIARSPFGTMLRGIKSNQNRLNDTGVNSHPCALAALVISGLYAGLAGALLVHDPESCAPALSAASRTAL